MKRRRFFTVMVLVLSLLILSLPVQAKGLPAFFTIEGNGLTTPIPFIIDVPPEMLVVDVLNADPLELALVDALPDDHYVLRSYTRVAGGDAGAGERFIQSMLSPMYYFPQEDGPGIVQYIGPDNVSSEWSDHFYTLTPELDAAIQQAIQLGEWYHMIPTE